jgi:hypothetical protein
MAKYGAKGWQCHICHHENMDKGSEIILHCRNEGACMRDGNDIKQHLFCSRCTVVNYGGEPLTDGGLIPECTADFHPVGILARAIQQAKDDHHREPCSESEEAVWCTGVLYSSMPEPGS